MSTSHDDPPSSQDAPQLGGEHAAIRSGNEPEISGARPRIVVLERFFSFEGFLRPVLEHQGYRIVHLREPDDVLPTLRRERPRLFIASPRYTHFNFWHLCRALRDEYPSLSIILWTIFPPLSSEEAAYHDLGVLFMPQIEQSIEMLRAVKLIMEDGYTTTDPRLRELITDPDGSMRESLYAWRRRKSFNAK